MVKGVPVATRHQGLTHQVACRHDRPGEESQVAGSDENGAGPPRLRVIRGDATPEELAALVVVLATRTAAAPPEPVRPRENWRKPTLRAPLAHGAGAWRASALPH